MANLIVQADKLAPTGRRRRNPNHPFQIQHRPYVIQPFFIAPVLPGETMKNLLMQSRVVTDPIKNPLLGWHIEYYFFYVKHRDLDDRDALVDMMVKADFNATPLKSAASVPHYHNGGINYVKKCLDRVVATYFRDEEDTTAYTLDGLPIAAVNNRSWLDSAKREVDVPAGMDDTIPDGEVVDPQFAQYYAQWEMMRAHKLITMDYDDYLRSFGIKLPESELVNPHKPELIRYLKDWSYPTNTINPADGKPTSAVSWAVAERADKDRFFKEPGFLFGVTLARPKVYMSNVKGTLTSYLDHAINWLPAVLRDEPYTSLKELPAAGGPLPGVTEAAGYWVDVRDLLLYGEQFVNFDLAATDKGMVALPTAAMQKEYVSSADVDALFVTPASANKVRQDGVVALQILGAQVETT
jgi:hypothetical protein